MGRFNRNARDAKRRRSSPLVGAGLGGALCPASILIAGGAMIAAPGFAGAAIMYFDNNGVTAGSTNSTAQQTWNTGNTNWSSDVTGSTATVAWVDGNDAVFSAGTNAVSAYPVVIAGAKIANSITVEEGTITFNPSATPPTRTIGAGGITLASTANGTMTWSNTNGGNVLIVNASQIWTDNHATAGFTVNCPVRGNAASGTYSLTAVPNGSGDMLFTGASSSISDGALGGNLAFAASGTGRVNIQGAASYTGGTSVTSGTMLLDNGGTLGHSKIAISGGTFAGGATGAGGTITDNINNDIDNEIISLSGSGTLDLTNLKFTLNATGVQTQAEYVLANAAVGSTNVIGSAFASTTLPAGWGISYTGTAANPNDIVLTNSNVPEPASLGMLTLTVLTLAPRRRRF